MRAHPSPRAVRLPAVGARRRARACREHALVDRDEAPERAQAVQVLAAARKPVEDAGRVRGEAVALEDVERFCGGVHGMDGHDAARARLCGAGGHDAVEGAELRRARRCMGAREVEPDFAHEFVGGGLGGRPRRRLLAGRARLDALDWQHLFGRFR